MVEDVTNSVADKEDFWYNSKEDYKGENDKYYAECVDHLVSTMGSNKDV